MASKPGSPEQSSPQDIAELIHQQRAESALQAVALFADPGPDEEWVCPLKRVESFAQILEKHGYQVTQRSSTDPNEIDIYDIIIPGTDKIRHGRAIVQQCPGGQVIDSMTVSSNVTGSEIRYRVQAPFKLGFFEKDEAGQLVFIQVQYDKEGLQ